MKEFFSVGQPGYYLLIVVFVGCLAALYLLRNGKKGNKQSKTASEYAVMTAQLLEETADDRLVNVVIKNLMEKLPHRHPDPLITIPRLSHGRNAVYFTWMLVKEVEHNGADALLTKPACRFVDVGVEGLTALGAERSAEAVRAFIANEATADAVEAVLTEEQPLNLCVEYIRNHTDEFIDE